MYSALIADDEAPIREGIAGYLREMGLFSQVFACKNGAEALETAMQHRPDLILTDIRMPIMDGLEFLRRYAQCQAASRMIVLSGYSDFEYAREAMRSGVADYLLKPIDNTLLAEKVMAQLAVLKSSDDTARLAEAQLISGALTGDLEALSILEKRGDPQPFMVAVCAAAPLDDTESDYVQTIAERFGDAVRKNGYPAQVTQKYGVPTAIIPVAKALPNERQLAASLFQSIDLKPSQYAVRVGVSRMYEDGSMLNRAYREALYAAFHALRENASSEGYRPGTAGYDHTAFLKGTDALKASAIKAANKGDPEKIRRVASDLFAFLSSGHYGDEAIVLFLQQTLQAALDRPDTNVRLHIKQPEQLLCRMIICARYEEIEAMFHDALSQACAGDAMRASSQGAMMGEVLQYIDQNLDSDLTLSGVCAHFFLSESHLCRLFKSKTPYTFNEYLTRARIRKACELLTTTNLKIYAVSDKIGIKNTKYFATLFKEMTGMTPSEFKNW